MDIKEYKKMITQAFARNTRGGFVDWRYCSRLTDDVLRILEDARREFCAEKRYADLFSLCNRTYVKWGNTDKDDSGGYTLDFASYIVDTWEVIYRDGEEEVSHRKMLDTLFKHLDGSVIDYMEDYVYEFILTHFKSEDELARKEQFFLDKMEELRQTDPKRYSLPMIEHYYVQVLADQKRPIEEIREFLYAGGGYTDQELLARIEMQYGNYDEAAGIYKAMIDDRPDAYWADRPRKALMEIYRAQGDTESYNKELYHMVMTHTGETVYYLEYKALFSEEEWQKEWEHILEMFADRLWMIDLWLSIEGRYDLIMDNAEPDNENVIDAYCDELFAKYPERCLKVLANAADRETRESTCRREYRRIAKILRKIAALPGGKALAAELAEKYRAQYPRRTAMIDVLKKF